MGNPKTILVVEDNHLTRKVVRIALKTEGYTVLEAPDGRCALELMAERLPDLVLQDLMLPDVDGFELLKRLRSMPGGMDVPILAFSAFVGKLEEARKLKLGFAGYIAKPIEPSQLIKAIRPYFA